MEKVKISCGLQMVRWGDNIYMAFAWFIITKKNKILSILIIQTPSHLLCYVPMSTFLLGIHHLTHVNKVIPLDRRDENFRKKCPTKATLQKKEVSQFVTYSSLMVHFSFSSMITLTLWTQKKKTLHQEWFLLMSVSFFIFKTIYLKFY